MVSDKTVTSVRSSVVVDAPIERAFSVFTEDMANWWPPEHHILQAKLADIVFEPRQGGNIYDRGEDGSECRWARVLAYDPPRRVVFSWDISLQWQIEEDPARPGRTRVELEHRAIERHGDGWEQMRDAVGSAEGWDNGLRAFATWLG